jgi:hypothetical protein
MAFNDFFEADAPFPCPLLPALAELRDNVLPGSDFPSIPYEYAHQLGGARAAGPGAGVVARRLLDNTERLLGLGIRGAPEAL